MATSSAPAPTPQQIYLGTGQEPLFLNLKFANRHGLIAGATGTGKTVSLQAIAENFSRHGIPVFLADVKGDLAGIAAEGGPNPKVQERLAALHLPTLQPAANPAILWDLYGEKGHPIRTTISELGPLLIARLLDLNETQAGVLNVCFSVADKEGLLLLDLKDLRSMLNYLGDHAAEVSRQYGNVTGSSIGAIQRGLLSLEQQGGDYFFGEPALEIRDLLRTTTDGRGQVSILAADKLIQSPKLYATFLLWLLSELYETLPEVGDLEKPRLAFFFDEAHLLFNDAPKALTDKVEQVVRLIRSKGVGIYFITQSPQDVPPNVLGQLSNRIQHALRAFTPNDQRAVKTAAQTFRANPLFSTEEAITQLAVGEALVSLLDENGSPTVVERALMCPPASRIGPLTEAERTSLLQNSPVAGQYDRAVDRESAFEKLAARVEDAPAPPPARPPAPPAPPVPAAAAPAGGGFLGGLIGSITSSGTGGRQRMGIGETMAKQMVRTVSSQLGRELVRGLLGKLLK